MITQNSKIKTQNYRTRFITFKRIFNFTLLIATLHFALLILHFQKANAQTSTNNNYNLEINDINTSPEESENSPEIPPPTEPSNQTNEIPGGIKSITQEDPLFFSISAGIVDFGTLSPGNPVIRNTALSVLSSSLNYQIISFEDHPLSTSDNQVIADTTCDNGACTELEEALWENQLTYGLGFRCESKIDFLCLGFSDENSYKQLADAKKLETPQTVIRGQKGDKAKEAQISLKLNTSGNQKTGSYSNTVTFILVPNY